MFDMYFLVIFLQFLNMILIYWNRDIVQRSHIGYSLLLVHRFLLNTAQWVAGFWPRASAKGNVLRGRFRQRKLYLPAHSRYIHKADPIQRDIRRRWNRRGKPIS